MKNIVKTITLKKILFITIFLVIFPATTKATFEIKSNS
jgi:hypothetical protein